MSCEEDYRISKESFDADQKLEKYKRDKERISSLSLGNYDGTKFVIYFDNASNVIID